LTSPPDVHALLTEYASDLPMLFIVSNVSIAMGQPGSAVQAVVAHATGDKCPRCWRFVDDVVRDGELEGVCRRCEHALGGVDAATA
jgi:isoleucyl-tRNA synthetase